jgi:hypothetical protein
MGHDLGMKSKVHPKYKTKYRVGNWAEYDRALVQRGDITLWIAADATAAWISAMSGRRDGQRKFSDHAIETALMLRLGFKLPLRQAESFLRSVLYLMGVDRSGVILAEILTGGNTVDAKPTWRTSSSGTSRSLATGPVLVIRSRRKWRR